MPPRAREALYTVLCTDGSAVLPNRTLLRLCEDGYIFQRLLFGGGGFAPGGLVCEATVDLTDYGVSRRALHALTLLQRHPFPLDLAAVALELEALGGFRSVDAALARHPETHHYNPMTPREDVRGLFFWRICRPWWIPDDFSVTQLYEPDAHHESSVFCRKPRHADPPPAE